MARGIIRKLDELGRITIPIEIRRATGIDVLVSMDLYIENGVIRLAKGRGRSMDELGRYTVPMEIRKRCGWKTGQELEVYFDVEEIFISKPGCEWCDETNDLIVINGHHLCISCTAAVTAAAVKVMED